MKLLYLGNRLSTYGYTPTSVETLGEKLKDTFKVVLASDRRNKFLRLWHMWWMVIKHRDCNYLIIDTYSSSAFFFAWTSARLAEILRIKYIPILHGGNLPFRAHQSPALMTRYLSRAYEVVCPSRYLKTEMEQVIGCNYQVISNYIDLNKLDFVERSLTEQGGIKLLWVRSFHEIYNPYLAVRVLHELISRGYTNTELCMVGPDKDGSLAKVLKLADELGVKKKLKITGLLSKDAWIKLSEDYNVFINTSDFDNTPVSVLEGIALGLPVVSTNVGGIPYLLRNNENALLVPPNDVGFFTEAVQKLLDSSTYCRIADSGRRLVEQFAWDRIKDKWMNILQNKIKSGIA